MKDVEIVDLLPHTIEHQHMVGDDVFRRGVKAYPLVEQLTWLAEVTESPLAKSVTSCPIFTSSSVR